VSTAPLPSPPPAASTAGQRGGAFSLDTWSSYDQDTPVTARRYRYPNGSSEAIISRAHPPLDPVDRSTAKGQGKNQEENDTRNRRRAKSEIRRCLLTADMDHLLTLTTRANVTDYETSRGQVTAFLRRLRKLYPGLKYVGVAELQKRGAFHWHIAINRRLDARATRSAWLKSCGDGNIDLKEFGDPSALTYVAKYVTKDMGHLPPGTPRYFRSRNITHDVEVNNYDNLDCALSDFSKTAVGWDGTFYTTDTGAIFLRDSGPHQGGIPHAKTRTATPHHGQTHGRECGAP